MKNFEFSFIIPVYNRPNEIQELLESFTQLDGDCNFEIVIVEDGSTETSESIVQTLKDTLKISYYYKTNTGPGDSRNYGMSKAKGNYFIILDSDVLLPSNYLIEVKAFLEANYYDCYGGPDASHKSFTNLQKAINFAMTSFLTTGGIRGGRQQVDDFQPRSFNMGMSKKAFIAAGGFGQIHPGEDPDLSLRLQELGFETTLIHKAFVYHKRRISWSKFFKQVYKFGMVRPIITQWHPNSASLLYWFPTLFSLGCMLSVGLLALSFHWFFYLLCFYFGLAIVLSTFKNKSINIGIQSALAIAIQFFGYGFGFLKSTILIRLLKRDPKACFPDLFFENTT